MSLSLLPRQCQPTNSRVTLLLILSLSLAAALPLLVRAALQSSTPPPSERKQKRAEFIPGEILVRFRKDAAATKSLRVEMSVVEGGRQIPLQVERLDGPEIVEGLRLARVAPEDTIRVIEALRTRPDVLYAEPNYIRRKNNVPNDPRYTEMWNLKNTGQQGGTPGVDIKAEQAWDITTGSRGIVVAVIDEGIDVNHQDLQANIWRNPGEVPNNGIDDDGNGFVDDLNGYDFFHNDAIVYDGPGTNPNGSVIDAHGTHVAGTIGGVGNNAIGVVGVNWQTSLMSLKFLGPNGGSTSDLIRAFSYARMMRDRWVNSGGTQGANIRVTNNSYGGKGYSQSEADAIRSMGVSDILFVAAAGNESEDNDIFPSYPASYDLPSVISVASIDQTGALSWFSNRGSHTVHIAAPGTNILSSTPGNTYSLFSGTSMASPHVAGTATLVLALHPEFTMSRLRAAILFGGEPVTSLDEDSVTGRRLSALGSLENAAESDTTPPAGVSDLHLSAQEGRSLTLNWTAPGDDGNAGRAALYEIRFVDQTTGAGFLLDTLPPGPAGMPEFSNIRIPYRHISGTISLRAIDNAGNESTASFGVTVPINAADRYLVTEGPASPLSSGGYPLRANFDDTIFGYGLPFDFPFFERYGTTVDLSSNGTIYFPPKAPSNDAQNGASLLSGWRMIAGLWDDLDLSQSQRADADIYVVQPDQDRIIFRWQGVPCDFDFIAQRCLGRDPVNFEIELRRDGTIVTRYGDGNTRLHPVVGLGGGERDSYVIDSHTSESSFKDLTNAPTVTYTLRSPPKVPNVTVTTAAYPEPVRIGQDLKLTILLGNSGQDPAASIVVTDTLPSQCTFISCTTSQGVCKGPAPGGNGKVSVGLGSIRPGGSVAVDILVNAAAAPGTGYYDNSVVVSSSTEFDKTSMSHTTAIRPNPNPLTGVSGIGAGANHSFALMPDGAVLGWGDNYYGQLGFENFIGKMPIATPVPGLSDIVAIDGGSLHSIALKSDGTVWTWGANYSGQLGDSTPVKREAPAPVNGLSNFTAVAAGDVHSMALRADGTVWAWGANAKGQLGDGTTIDTNTPVQVGGLTNVRAIAAGADHSMAIKNDGTVWTWGGNDGGQLGDGTTISKSSPIQVSSLGGVTAVSGGIAFTLAVKSDGTVWAWGLNSFGQLGDGTNMGSTSPTQVVGLNSVVSVSAANEFSVALRNDGTVWTWGHYLVPFGTIGQVNRAVPSQVLWLTGISSVVAGGNHALARQQDGTVWAWGFDDFAQLGDGSAGYARWWPHEVTAPPRRPDPIGTVAMPTFNPNGGTFTSAQNVTIRSASADASIASVAFGTHSLFLMSDGTIWASGPNFSGQLGDGTTSASLVPVQSKIDVASAIAPGAGHSMALKPDGTVWSWGGNGNGQLGISAPETVTRLSPVKIDSLTSITAISAGGAHSLALKADGTVWAWGWNDQGQVGDGSQTDRFTPIQVQGLAGIKVISAGIHHNLALKIDGTVWAWGDNRWGEIGDGSTVFRRLTPVQVAGLSNIVAIGAGGEFSVALRGDGTVWTWGDNEEGELGIGQIDGIKHPLPAQVSVLNSVSKISVGAYHLFATLADGSIWGWGSNYAGQLGNGETQTRPAPIQLNAAIGAMWIIAGSNSAAMGRPDGSVSVWGANDSGQLGLGNTTNRTAPVNLNQPDTGVIIHYTTNGNDPGQSDPAIASGSSVLVDHSLMLKAKAFKSGWTSSLTKGVSYTIVAQGNPIDEARAFVRQQYLDFLSREPDQGGWDYWTNQILQCGPSDALCIHNRRVAVSDAFFFEPEFQQTGSYVFRLYRAAYGDNQPFPNPDPDPRVPGLNLKLPNYAVFNQDRAQVVGGAGLAQSQLDLANAFVQRPEFLARYPAGLSAQEFINAVLATIQSADPGVDLSSEQSGLMNLYNQGGRGAVIYRLADDNVQTNTINNRGFIDAEYNRTFVTVEYFGYLRRDADTFGLNFWLGQLNRFPLRDINIQHAMVCSFITSIEYQQRFGSTVTHTNAECPQ